MIWHPPMRYLYSYRTHDGVSMLLVPGVGYPRQWMRGPRLPVSPRQSENVEGAT